MIAVSLRPGRTGELPAFEASAGEGMGLGLVIAAADLGLGDGSGRCLFLDPPEGGLPRASSSAVLLVVARTLGGESRSDDARQRYRSLLDRGIRVIPWPVLLSRDGLPALRRALGRLDAARLGLAVDLQGWLGEPAAADALVGVARTLRRAHRRGRWRLVSVDVCGWTPRTAADPAARALLGRLLAPLLAH